MVKIYVMTHKLFQKPQDEIYIPLHVGRAASQDLSYLGDDTGDNISALNCYYGELTGLYWIWKHETEADIVGICHYRRYFLNESGMFLNKQEYESILAEYDVMTSKLMGSALDNWTNYAACHNRSDMEAVGEAVKKLYPSDYEAFSKVLSDTKCCYGNLMVTTLDKYREYCAWLFPILEEAGKKIDVSSYDLYRKRVFGFLSEVLLYVWAVARGYRIYEGKIGLTAEKAETVEFKHDIERLVQQGDLEAAKEFFYHTMQERPDLRLGLSDLKGEIPIVEKLLYIMHQEQKEGGPRLLALSRELAVLIEHYKNSANLIAKNGSSARSRAKAYFDVFALSDTAFGIIEQDVNGSLSFYHYLNEGEPAKKVCAVVSVSSCADTLSGCIGNLVNQTMEDLAVIFIDSCEDAAGKRLLLECMQQYPKKVQVFTAKEWNRQLDSDLSSQSKNQSGPDLGSGNGMQHAADLDIHMTGRQAENRPAAMDSEYIIFVRGEDMPDPAMCEKLYQKAETGGWKLAGGKYIDHRTGNIKQMLENEKHGYNSSVGLDEAGTKNGLEFCPGSDKVSREGNGNIGWGILIHNSLWKEIRERFKIQEDGQLRIKEAADFIVSSADSAGSVDEVLYGYSG